MIRGTMDVIAGRARRPEKVAHAGIAGDLRVHRGVRSGFLRDSRDVWVWLPPGYDAARGARYPVLYAHDGNNLFDPQAAFGGREWQVDETAQRLCVQGLIEPLIVVGVGNSAARIDEYTWVPEGRHGGRGARYGKFLAEELKPFIDANYRTRPGREWTGAMGSSLGGLITLYLGIHHADTFSRLAVVSPSIWWANRAVLTHVESMRGDLRIWLDTGIHEGRLPRQQVLDTRRLRLRLQQKGYRIGESLEYLEDPHGGHDEVSWSRRVPRILSFLFPLSAARAGAAHRRPAAAAHT
jgi:predicted alpha/beta superfamily hydrolase